MANFWKEIVDVLRSPAFRIGSGVAGLASGAGAFEGLGDWGQALSGISGAANIASGAATAFGPGRSDFDKITGGLQIGLGGYNVGQGFGEFGTFGNIYDSLSGGGGTTGGGTTTIGGGATAGDTGTTGLGFGESYGGPVTTGMAPTTDAALPAIDTSIGGGAGTQSLMNPTGAQSTYTVPTYAGSDQDTFSLGSTETQAAPIDPAWRPGDPVAIPPMPTPAGPTVVDRTIIPQADPNARPIGSPAPSPAPTPTPTPTPIPAGDASAALPPSQPIDMQPYGPPSSLAPAAAQGDWFDRTWSHLATTAERNPLGAAMTALSIGAMIAQQFSGSRADIARDALAELRANQPPPPVKPGEPTPPPPMPDSKEFRKLFEEKATSEIDKMYQTARSSLTARFGSRGMLNSTVYTNALESLDKARIDSVAQLPAASLTAWNQALGEWTRAAAVINQTNQTNMQSADAYNRSLLAYADQQAKNLQTVTSYVNAAVPQTNFADMTRILAQSPFVQSMAARQQA